MNSDLSLIHGPPLDGEPGQGAQTIPGFLGQLRDRHGNQEAVVMRTAHGRTAWTYDELYANSVKVAKALVVAGIGKNSRVGVLMANRPEYLAAVFGIAMAGGVTVALSTFSTPSELDHLISASAISTLLFDARVLKQDFAAMLGESDHHPFLTKLVQLNSVTDDLPVSPWFDSWDDFIDSGKSVLDGVVQERSMIVNPQDIGGIFFSSGTTSAPKGIIHSHQAFCIQWWRWPRVFTMHEPVRSWTGNGFFWSGNISMTVGTALATGGAVILQPVFDAETALRTIEQERVTFLSGRPHQWARVQAAPNWATADLSTLKYVTKGDLITEHPSVQTNWTTPNAFGTTETMTICTAFDANTSDADYAGSVGEPLPGNSLKIVNPATGDIVPVGARGEMCIKGPTLMRGYLGKRQEDCFDSAGYYCTGDGGYVDTQGRFFWEGRLNDIIKTGGANVSPEEVDSVIVGFPGIKRSQTVGVPDALLGERVVACIVPVDATAINRDGLVEHLKSKLAAYKLPKQILAFTDDEFVRTGNEKPVVADIRQRAQQRLENNG